MNPNQPQSISCSSFGSTLRSRSVSLGPTKKRKCVESVAAHARADALLVRARMRRERHREKSVSSTEAWLPGRNTRRNSCLRFRRRKTGRWPKPDRSWLPSDRFSAAWIGQIVIESVLIGGGGWLPSRRRIRRASRANAESAMPFSRDLRRDLHQIAVLREFERLPGDARGRRRTRMPRSSPSAECCTLNSRCWDRWPVPDS